MTLQLPDDTLIAQLIVRNLGVQHCTQLRRPSQELCQNLLLPLATF